MAGFVLCLSVEVPGLLEEGGHWSAGNDGALALPEAWEKVPLLATLCVCVAVPSRTLQGAEGGKGQCLSLFPFLWSVFHANMVSRCMLALTRDYVSKFKVHVS